MPKYIVTWEIDSEAESPLEAAREAWRMMHNEGSIANVFIVEEDLGDGEYGKSIEIDLEDYKGK